MSRPHTAALPILLLLALLVSPARGQDTVPPVELEAEVHRAFQAERYDEALALIERFLAGSPDNVDMLYNAACALCRLGHRDQAASYLLRSVEAGFRDFTHMRRDPDLAGLRDHPTFQAILEAAARVDRSDRRAFSAVERWREQFGEQAYRYEKDDEHHLWFATALDETSHREMREMLEAEADQLIATLFESPPDYEVLVAVPTPADAAALFGADDHIGGIYQHAQRRLIARDIGSTLRHEFFHLMHYGDMERRQQPHQLWVQEGMASLYEDYELGGGAAIRFLPNERHNIVHRRARGGGLTRWRDLFAMDGDQFMRRANHLYPQVRSMFEYLADHGKLQRWYRGYIELFDEDPSGARAFERVFDRPIDETERDWRRWVLARPLIDTAVERGDASLGLLTAGRESNDGVVVARVLPRSGAQASGIRRGDVIVSIDDRPTRSPSELQGVIAARRVGERVEVRLRRGEDYVTLLVELRPLTGSSVPFR